MESNVTYLPSVPSTQIDEHTVHSTRPIAATVCGLVLSVSLISGTGSYQPLEQPSAYVAAQLSPSFVGFDVQEYCFRPASNVYLCDEWLFSPQVPIIEQQAESSFKRRGVLAMIDKEVPIPFIACGAMFVLAFFLAVRALVAGMAAGAFIMNPVYLFELAFGFFGLTVTDLVAIREWRKKRGWKERKNP